MEISLDDVLTFIQRTVIPNFMYSKNKYLDIATGDIVSTKEVRDLLGMVNSAVLLHKRTSHDYTEQGDRQRDEQGDRQRDEQGDIEVLYGREGLNQIPSNSIDVLTMFFVIHHLSDQYLETMNTIANITKAGSLLVISDYDIHDFDSLSEIEFRHMYDKADTTDDYRALVEQSRVSYTSFEELKESMVTFGFYLLFKSANQGPYNQYFAVFRKSSAPRRVYIPVFIHPVHSIEAGNISDYLGYEMTDEQLYNEYKKMKT